MNSDKVESEEELDSLAVDATEKLNLKQKLTIGPEKAYGVRIFAQSSERIFNDQFSASIDGEPIECSRMTGIFVCEPAQTCTCVPCKSAQPSCSSAPLPPLNPAEHPPPYSLVQALLKYRARNYSLIRKLIRKSYLFSDMRVSGLLRAINHPYMKGRGQER